MYTKGPLPFTVYAWSPNTLEDGSLVAWVYGFESVCKDPYDDYAFAKVNLGTEGQEREVTLWPLVHRTREALGPLHIALLMDGTRVLACVRVGWVEGGGGGGGRTFA